MRWGLFIMAFILTVVPASAFWSQSNYLTAPSFDWHVSYPQYSDNVYVIALYDDTDIYYDDVLDGVYTLWTTLDRGGTANSDFDVSTKLHATKPILVTSRAEYWAAGICCPNGYGWWSSHEISGENVLKDFIVPSPINYLFITATEYSTNLLIDTSNDGTWDVNTTIYPNSGYSYSSSTAPAGSRVKADKPILAKVRAEYDTSGWRSYITSGMAIQNTSGQQFYIAYPIDDDIHVMALQNNTILTLDQNNDGTEEYSWNLDKNDVQTITSTEARVSAFLEANKPVIATQEIIYLGPGDGTGYEAIDYLYPAQKLAQEYYVGSPYNELYITATRTNTNLLIDKTNDGTWDTNTTIEPGSGYTAGSNAQAGSHILADKPVIARQFYDITLTYPAYSGGNVAAASITSTADIQPNIADFNILANITYKIWNMREAVNNLTISGSIHSDFIPYPDTSNLNISVTKYWTNSTQIGSDNIQVSLSGTGPYNYQLSYTDSNLLEELDDEQYIEYTYQATTPSTTGTYIFDPVTINVGSATVWKYSWE